MKESEIFGEVSTIQCAFVKHSPPFEITKLTYLLLKNLGFFALFCQMNLTN